jgi:hypothetical protein
VLWGPLNMSNGVWQAPRETLKKQQIMSKLHKTFTLSICLWSLFVYSAVKINST